MCIRDSSKIVVIAPARFFGIEQCKERVVKVVAPLRIHPVAHGFARPDYARVVQIAFHDQIELARQRSAQPFNLFRHLFQKVHCRTVHKFMHGIEAQAIAVVIL